MKKRNQYLPNEEDVFVNEMLKVIGQSSAEDLFSDIPEEIRLKRELNLDLGRSDVEVERTVERLLEKNGTFPEHACFLGGGVWHHYVPALVDEVLSRAEFYTSYTPYQPEISQGLLQALFEYQSLICDLTAMDVANSSHYDWSTALGEGARMAGRIKGKKRVLVASNASPERISVLKTYTECSGTKVDTFSFDPSSGQVDLGSLERLLGDNVAAVYLENPSFFGVIEEYVNVIAEMVHDHDALFMVGVDPISLGIIKPPGEYGADIVVGEVQPLGMPVNFGGPLLGILATRGEVEMLRQMPGRIIGLTREKEGRSKAFAMILQTREQHIRREAATSNICTNQALCAVAAAVYLSMLGPKGFRELSLETSKRAHYAVRLLAELNKVECPYFKGPFFREFTLEFKKHPKNSESIFRELMLYGVLGGLPLSRFYKELRSVHLFSFTEMHTKEDLERLAYAARMVSR